jgi:DNA transformation protein and related proteins
MSDLSEMQNIGKEVAQRLTEVGINTSTDLKSVGSEQAFLRLKAIDPGACFSMLCALEGAISDIRWHNLPAERKQELKQFFIMTKKSGIK